MVTIDFLLKEIYDNINHNTSDEKHTSYTLENLWLYTQPIESTLKNQRQKKSNPHRRLLFVNKCAATLPAHETWLIYAKTKDQFNNPLLSLTNTLISSSFFSISSNTQNHLMTVRGNNNQPNMMIISVENIL